MGGLPKYATDPRNQREHVGFDPLPGRDGDLRVPSQRDHDRLFYSPYWQRLSGVTQVAAAGELFLLHNRLTHSLKVSQVGLRLAQLLGKRQSKIANMLRLDANVVETAGLAHDIGHPPFGHIAEDELDQILQERELRFNGNAQTFRIVTKLAPRKRPEISEDGRPWKLHGLDLTRATLNAILKYPAFEQDRLAVPSVEERWRVQNWGVYESEKASFAFARRDMAEQIGHRTPEAILVDWSDDVSYATHDIEDYVRAGLIRFAEFDDSARARLLESMERRFMRLGVQYDSRRVEAAIYAFAPPVRSAYLGDFSAEHDLRDWVSRRVTQFSNAVALTDDPPWVTFQDIDAMYSVEVLKAIIRNYVIRQPAFAASQEGQRRIIREVFERLEAWINHGTVLPRRLAELLYVIRTEDLGTPERNNARVIADYICSLTEKQLCDLHARLSSGTGQSMVQSWL